MRSFMSAEEISRLVKALSELMGHFSEKEVSAMMNSDQ